MGVGWGLILGKSGEAAKAGAILSLPLLALLPAQPLCWSQAAVAQGLRQVWRGLFREQREVLAGDTSHPMNYFNARLDLQARSKVIIGPIKLIYMDSMLWLLPQAVVGRLTHHTLAPSSGPQWELWLMIGPMWKLLAIGEENLSPGNREQGLFCFCFCVMSRRKWPQLETAGS